MTMDNAAIASMTFTCRVKLDEEFKSGFFNVGRMSNTLVFDPAHSVPVTLWTDPWNMPSNEDIFARFYILKTHKFDHIAKVSDIDMSGKMPFIMLDGVVRHTLGSWIQSQFEQYKLIKDGSKWLDTISCTPYLRDFALGLLELYDHRSIFDGTVYDLHVSDAGLRIAKLVDCTESEFDGRLESDILIFRKVIHHCVFYPLHQGNFRDVYRYTEDECRQLGVNKDLDILLFDLKDSSRMKNLPPSVFLDHPGLFGRYSVDNTTYSRKLNLDILFAKHDNTVKTLDQWFFNQGIFWKENLPDGSVKDTLDFMENQRAEKDHVDNMSKDERTNYFKTNLREHLFRDFVKLFFNCEKHMDRFELVHGNWQLLASEEIIDLVDRSMLDQLGFVNGRWIVLSPKDIVDHGGSLSLIHSKLIALWSDVILASHCGNNRIQYLKKLRCWCFSFIKPSMLAQDPSRAQSPSSL